MFRGKENQYVVSISKTGGSNPIDRVNIGFDTKAQALTYIKNIKKW